VLVDRARRRNTIRQHELIAAVETELKRMAVLDGELDAADRRLFRSLLDEIAAAETCAQRPSLGLIVQERRPREPQLRAQLQLVWDYWAPEDAANGSGVVPAAALRTATRGLLRAI